MMHLGCKNAGLSILSLNGKAQESLIYDISDKQ